MNGTTYDEILQSIEAFHTLEEEDLEKYCHELLKYQRHTYVLKYYFNE